MVGGSVWTAVRGWARTAPMPRVVVAAAGAWAALTTGAAALLSLATGWWNDDPWYGDFLGSFLGSLVLAWLLLAGWRARGTDAERAHQALAQRRLPIHGDPSGLRRALVAQRRRAVLARRVLPPVLVLGAGGLLWLALLGGGVELWVAAAFLVAVAAMVFLLSGGRIRLADALIDQLDVRAADVPPGSPPTDRS